MLGSFEKSAFDAKEIADHFLFPSTLHVSNEPHRIQTILGSCVAVCIYDEIMRSGGMNHYMLPWWNGKGVPSPKYGDVAIDLLLEKMTRLGSQKRNLVAKIFGGASQLSFGEHKIGIRNIETAESELGKLGIRIVSQDVGGFLGRKIIQHTDTGQVFMKYLNSK